MAKLNFEDTTAIAILSSIECGPEEECPLVLREPARRLIQAVRKQTTGDVWKLYTEFKKALADNARKNEKA